MYPRALPRMTVAPAGQVAQCSQWQLVQVPVVARPIRDMDGHQLSDPQGRLIGGIATVPPSTIAHWMNATLARAWINEARRQQRIAASNSTSREMVSTPYGTDWVFLAALRASFNAVAQAYNALNLPWQIDPFARNLYRRYCAGHAGFNLPIGNPIIAEFAPGNNYAYPFGLYSSPGFSAGSGFRGWNDWNQIAAQFDGQIPNAAYGVLFGAPSAGGSKAFYQEFRLDQAVSPGYVHQYVTIGGQSVPYSVFNSPSVVNTSYGATDFGAYHFNRCLYMGNLPCAQPVEYRSPSDWSAYWSGGDFDTFAASLLDYNAWLNDWITALEGRSTNEIVQDSTAYQLYLNLYTVHFYGDRFDSLLAAIGTTQAALSVPNPRVEGVFHTVSATAAALGTALAAPTSGISALVGGAIALTFSLLSTGVPPDLSHVYVDDLFRPKPVFERGWLSGDPSDPINGCPDIILDMPPGYAEQLSRVQAFQQGMTQFGPGAINVARGSAILPTNSPATGAPPNQPTELPTWALIAGGLAVGGLLVYGVRKSRG